MEKEAELFRHLKKGEDMATLCSSCKELASHVLNLLNNEKRDEVICCLSGVLDIYKTTSKPTVITAIENVFIYNVGSHLLLKDHCVDDIFPDCFRDILKMQMIGSKI